MVLERCANSGHQVAMATTFCTVAPNLCGSSVDILLHVTLLASEISRWLLAFGKLMCARGVVYLYVVYVAHCLGRQLSTFVCRSYTVQLLSGRL